MEVVPLRPAHIDALYAIYLAQVARSPHSCFAPDFRRFQAELLGGASQPTTLFPQPQDARTLVAEDAGTAQGFATLITYDPGAPNGNGSELEQQAITGLFVANEGAGDALIDACEAQATTVELGAFPATHCNTPLHTYNAAWDGLSDRVPNVAHLLTKHGYTPYFRELNLVAPLPLGARATRMPSSQIIVIANDAADSVDVPAVRVMDGEKQAGICSYSTLAVLSDVPAASRTGYIWELYVDPAYRRRGIARALMVTAMNQLASLGCTACWLTTTANNWNAQSLYYSLEFEVVDNSVSFRKQIRS